MSEWWTYRLSDFLLFSPRTYYRLFEIYNRAVWPLHIVTLAAGVLILIRILRARALTVFLAVDWLFIAWFFQIKRYATIQWAAKWFAVGFVIEAALLIWIGVIQNRFRSNSPLRPAQICGAALFAFALLIEPLTGLLAGRPWLTMEVFGIAPDPTAVATLGIALFAGERVRAPLLIVPLLWCAISGATLWTLHAPDALVLPIAGIVAIALAVWNRCIP
jgi:hypothetical protein